MPFSTNIFKEEIIDFINRKFDNTSAILDVGAGSGIYGQLLKRDFPNIDAIEVFEPYVTSYDLPSKYRNVFVGDVLTTNEINFEQYSLFILGDVFEHLSETDARALLDKLSKVNAEIIVAVPFNSPQGEAFDNKYERHLQPKLSLVSMLKDYPELIPLCVRYDYGVFVSNKKENQFLSIFYKDLEDEFIQKLKEGYRFRSLINVDEYKNKTTDIISLLTELEHNKETTIVTGLWNLGRGDIGDDFKRSYEHYKEKFAELLKTKVNMIIYVSKEDEEFVWKHRSRKNTFVKVMELEEFETWFAFFEKTQEIRNKPEWFNQAGWLSNSPQAKLKYYNPVVMSKMFLLNNSTIYNPFDSEYFYWIDAGITNTVHPGYFTHDNVFDKLSAYSSHLDSFLFLSYPYEGGYEIHGFPRPNIAKYSGTDYVKYVCRGGFFGGKKTDINTINALYYEILSNSLNEGLMGTEESIFTVIAHKFPELVHRFQLEGNGLIWPFFEKLKDVEKLIKEMQPKPITYDKAKNIIYILTFNSPKQFESICKSIKESDTNFFGRSRKILINNSTDETTFDEYDKLCEVYGFEELHKENLGVCGGRQFAAEHFEQTDAHFYMFFEDDMHLNASDKASLTCRNGFRSYVPNLYETVVKIMLKEKFDFLKFSFSEFYGDNSVQWAWYNVPQKVRTEVWPGYDKLPEYGLDPKAPKTKMESIHYMNQTPYIKGQIYYSNWPQIVSREGNYKMFLNTTWARPYEQTWMSHIFQMTLTGDINAGILLASPVTHERFDFYEGNLRKES